MKAVLQRVTQASVTVDGKVVSRVGRGIVALIGVGTGDSQHESQWLASKILGMKLFPEDKDGESWGWKYNVAEAGYEVLCISQFTLMANLRKGSKPDFHDAMSSETSKDFYDAFLTDMRGKYKADKIFDGVFGAMMDVQLVNDGPVTLILDSTTDAPARPVPKAALTPEQKAKAKEKADRRSAGHKSNGKNGAAAVEKAKEVLEGAKSQRAVEKQTAELEERFKETLGLGA